MPDRRCSHQSNSVQIKEKAEDILRGLSANPGFNKLVDGRLQIPDPYPRYISSGDTIKLIILGQDPTVEREKSRSGIRTVLNLDRGGALKSYLSKICSNLGLELGNHVYATNYLKNFFRNPPARLDRASFSRFGELWLPLLKEELLPLENVPVITLGEPVLSILTRNGAPAKVRDYWGYNPDWKPGKTGPLRYLKPEENVLDRVLFPFPHQRSSSQPFYHERMPEYIEFVRETIREQMPR